MCGIAFLHARAPRSDVVPVRQADLPRASIFTQSQSSIRGFRAHDRGAGQEEDAMSAQMLTVAVQIAAGCIWLLTLACASSANEMSTKQRVVPDGASEPQPMSVNLQPAHP
jgi:hypothetical protein